MLGMIAPTRKRLTFEQAEEIRRRVSAGERRIDLAQEFGVKPCSITAITQQRVHNPQAAVSSSNRGRNPSPEEIRKLCGEIQATWTEEERRQRVVGSLYSWEVVDLSQGGARHNGVVMVDMK